MDANDRWKNIEAQKHAKADIKVCLKLQKRKFQLYVVYSLIDLMQRGIVKRIEEKESERDSFELQISHVDLSHIDEREKNMVGSSYPTSDFSKIGIAQFLLEG